MRGGAARGVAPLGRERLAALRLPSYSSSIPPPFPTEVPVRLTPLPLLAAALVVIPALAEPPKSDIDLALAKAKKEKKLVSLVFTQFG